MKLYSMVASERARKGQGGNKNILTVITAEIAGWRQEITSTSVINTDKGFYAIEIKTPSGKVITERVSKRDCELKANKQKDEKCYCSDDDMSIPHYH